MYQIPNIISVSKDEVNNNGLRLSEFEAVDTFSAVSKLNSNLIYDVYLADSKDGSYTQVLSNVIFDNLVIPKDKIKDKKSIYVYVVAKSYADNKNIVQSPKVQINFVNEAVPKLKLHWLSSGNNYQLSLSKLAKSNIQLTLGGDWTNFTGTYELKYISFKNNSVSTIKEGSIENIDIYTALHTINEANNDSSGIYYIEATVKSKSTGTEYKLSSNNFYALTDEQFNTNNKKA